MNFLYTAIGAALLYLGGETLVKNASRLGRSYGLSPLIVGLTIVAFGTSSPELATSIAAVLRGSPQISLGNVIGSNIANLALILGITAVIFPLKVLLPFLRRDGVAMLLSSALLVPFGLNGTFGRLEGLALVALLAAYLYMLFSAREIPPEVAEEFEAEYGEKAQDPIWHAWVGVLVGLVVLVLGADRMVAGGSGLARQLGVPERIIGLTIVAFGTSLPELATSIAASVRREADIVLGNVVGSNIFNVLIVLGITSIVEPVRVPWAAVRVDIGIMLGITVITLAALGRRLHLSRPEGVLFLSCYLAYFIYLFAG